MLAVVLKCSLCNLTSKDAAFPRHAPDHTGTRATNRGRWAFVMAWRRLVMSLPLVELLNRFNHRRVDSGFRDTASLSESSETTPTWTSVASTKDWMGARWTSDSAVSSTTNKAPVSCRWPS